jgi:dienelactone hydrolase
MIAGAVLAGAPLAAVEPARADIKTGLIDYNADLPLEGYLAYDESIQGKRPGILVAHTQRGIQDFVRGQTRELAKLGYVALAADFYGKGIRPLEDAPAQQQSSKIKSERALTRRRIQAGYDVLRAHPLVQEGQLAVIGYCVGGLVALELARAGTPLLATAVFHGTLTTPTPEDAKNIKGRVLVLHGADDPTAPLSEVDALVKEMRAAGVDFQLELYGGVKHGFTEPHNSDPKRNAFYNERAARQSWASMQTMFNEVFQR